VSSSGVFADGVQAEGNPPVRGLAGSDERPASQHQRPTTDDRRSTMATDRSRPDTELQE
jgi:hypothetical protein